jgi:hypothetical protein
VDNFPDMQKILERLDELAGIETKNNFAEWLERIAFVEVRKLKIN